MIDPTGHYVPARNDDPPEEVFDDEVCPKCEEFMSRCICEADEDEDEDETCPECGELLEDCECD